MRKQSIVPFAVIVGPSSSEAQPPRSQVLTKIAYLGPAGTFTEEAVVSESPDADRLPCQTIRGVAEAVESGKADMGIVPIENSNEGSVPDTLDLLIHQSPLRICKELVLPINQFLMARPGTTLGDIQVVYSHPNALGQCRGYIEKRLAKAQVIATLSTSAAVLAMKEHPGPAAAIGPKRAADLYGVEILAEKVQDNEGNATRFVVLAQGDHAPTGKDKTSIAFSFAEDKPGQLYAVLGDFASRSINLSKLESRPAKAGLGKYIFLVDLDGHRTDPRVVQALDSVQKRASMLKVFGSYPRYTEPGR
ncbi:MAG: pheA [Dehalococcoidia bacterium]|nr:pheA [Dehalococcoidia bacterium]